VKHKRKKKNLPVRLDPGPTLVIFWKTTATKLLSRIGFSSHDAFSDLDYECDERIDPKYRTQGPDAIQEVGASKIPFFIIAVFMLFENRKSIVRTQSREGDFHK
jgi:hypothetical protein